MKCIIVNANASQFTGKKGEIIKGASLDILREKDLQVKRYWISEERLVKMGFKDQMVSNPFEEDEPQMVDATFDEGRNGKITPTSFKLI